MNSDENLLVFVDEAHAGVFNQYRGHFGHRSSRVMEGEKGVSRYFLLSDPADDFHVSVAAMPKENRPSSNVVGKIEGNRKDEIVLFTAHYDHIGIQNVVEGDSIANGANDNASGVTAVIELARYFQSLGKPERTLLFVGFTAEEIGGYGSQYFSQQVNPDHIVAMFNIEMIGKPAISGPNTAWITGYDNRVLVRFSPVVPTELIMNFMLILTQAKTCFTVPITLPLHDWVFRRIPLAQRPLMWIPTTTRSAMSLIRSILRI